MIIELDKGYLEACLRIERKCFSEPWTRAMLESEFEQLTTCVWGWLEGPEEKLVAYMVCWLIFEDFHIANLAVLPEMRRRGIGRSMLDYALGWAVAHQAKRSLLEVRASNSAAVSLYRDAGFSLIGTRPKYYRSPTEDALILQKRLP